MFSFFPKDKVIQRYEAIILHALPYRDADKILTLFTQELGVVKCVVYRTSAKKLSAGATDPLTCIEIMLSEGRGDLFKAGDISILSHNLGLRTSLDRLKAACAITQAIQESQMLQKPSPLLYALFKGYLERIPTIKNLPALVNSFYLKLMRHEGHLHSQPHCSACQTLLNEGFLWKGESLCREHAPPSAILFSSEEFQAIHWLAHLEKYSNLEAIPITQSLKAKIEDLLQLA